LPLQVASLSVSARASLLCATTMTADDMKLAVEIASPIIAGGFTVFTSMQNLKLRLEIARLKLWIMQNFQRTAHSRADDTQIQNFDN
jgi:hypothetical protein